MINDQGRIEILLGVPKRGQVLFKTLLKFNDNFTLSMSFVSLDYVGIYLCIYGRKSPKPFSFHYHQMHDPNRFVDSVQDF